MKMCPLFLLCVVANVSLASASAAQCKETEFGKCFVVHGRYNIYADGDAIWIVGTHRRLEATDPNLDKTLEQAGWQDHSVYGDFTVCPESPDQPHHKQAVCIQSYKNIKLGPWK